MFSSILKVCGIILLIWGCSSQKKISSLDSKIEGQLRTHINYLADDKLEGRRTGTAGEQLAVEYITTQFKEIGLVPKGTEYYTQSFVVNDGKKIDSVTTLSIDGVNYKPDEDFFPFPYSPDISIEALPSIDVQEAEMPWFVDINDILEENKSNPHFDLPGYIRKNAEKARDRGASAVILYNSSATDDKLMFDPKDRSESLSIPVLYVKKSVSDNLLKDKSATVNLKMRVGVGQRNRLGYNVIGFIDNKVANTVVLGAHFDHLGYGEDGNSMIRNGQPSIHNGADDNASGTASLIELARQLNAGPKGNNYLFIAFSGEELGLYGSKYFTENPTIDLKSINYMINMDMVGRLNDSSKTLTVGGFGTSPVWSGIIGKSSNAPLNIKIDSSGTGPSDHTSFYRKDIPVLFYFTGLHSDYHKPSDDSEKINYKGTVSIIDNIYSVIKAVDKHGKLAFTKTREAQTSTSARFSVSLGIMPDYTYSGAGVRADGVSEGRAAQKAGIKQGDIVVQLGEYTISSMETYMQALSKFKKGDKTIVKFKRGEQVLEANVEF